MVKHLAQLLSDELGGLWRKPAVAGDTDSPFGHCTRRLNVSIRMARPSPAEKALAEMAGMAELVGRARTGATRRVPRP